MTLLKLAGGRITCLQCSAKSKRSLKQCQAPAMKGKTKCAFHGGKSTGPKTAEGKAKSIAAHTKTGQDTRAIRAEHSIKVAELEALETLGYAMDYMIGPKTRGPKSKHYADALRDLIEDINNLPPELTRTPFR